jgi:hypothetical protein
MKTIFQMPAKIYHRRIGKTITRRCLNDAGLLRRLDIGNIAATEVTPLMVDDALIKLQADNAHVPKSAKGRRTERLSGSTLNIERSFLNNIFAYGIRHGEVAVNP